MLKLTSADRLLGRAVLDGGRWNALLLAANVVRSGGALLLPAALARAIDAQLAGSGQAAVSGLALLVAVLVAAEVATQLVSPWCVNTITAGMRARVLSRVLHLGADDRTRFTLGDLTSRLLTNTTEAGSVVPVISTWLTSLLVSGGALIALGLIDVRLAVTFLLGIPPAVLLVKAFIGRITPLMTRYLELQGRISARLMEVLGAVRSIRAAAAEHREAERILGEVPALHRTGQESWHAQGSMNMRAALLMPLMQVAVLITAGYSLAEGRISPGELTAAAGYAGMALGLFGQANVFMALAQSRAGARRVAEVHDSRELARGDRELPPGPGRLTLDDVTVLGPAGPLLEGATLTVPGGGRVAVVGRSGAGKSTLAAVAGRMIEPDAGTVALDGVPLAELRPSALRTAIGWAFERPSYLGATLGDSIRFGNPGLTDEGVRRAAAAARADSFIRRLPEGYASPPHNAPLSGGEQQRIGLARALARTSRLLILDDATSSLDSVTEMQISRILSEELGDTTQLVLTHRVSTAAAADLVAWVEDGRVRALAPHGQLWTRPDYRSVFRPETSAPDNQPELTHAD